MGKQDCFKETEGGSRNSYKGISDGDRKIAKKVIFQYQGNPVLAVLFIAVIGGLIASFVCSGIMLFTAGILIQDMSEQLQNISINCSEEKNLFASVITLGGTVYYCTFEKTEKVFSTVVEKPLKVFQDAQEKKKGQEYSLPSDNKGVTN